VSLVDRHVDADVPRRVARFVRAAGLAGIDPDEFDAVAAVTAAAPNRRRDQRPVPASLKALLCDRDGTLVADVPYNHDPDQVRPLPGVRAALDRARRAGLRIAVVTNQSGIRSGRITPAQLGTVHRRLGELLGPFDTILACPHGPGDGCGCRKPRPGLITRAATQLGVHPSACVVIGDTGSDVVAATHAGAWPILVPNGRTRQEEIDAAPVVVSSFAAAVRLVI